MRAVVPAGCDEGRLTCAARHCDVHPPQAVGQVPLLSKLGASSGVSLTSVLSQAFKPGIPKPPVEVAVPTIQWQPVTVMTPTVQVTKMGARGSPGRGAAARARCGHVWPVSRSLLFARSPGVLGSRAAPRNGATPAPPHAGFCIPRTQWNVVGADAVDCPPQTYMQQQNGQPIW
jgi:hypothetical protein